ncbi:PepSY domain-containing protein [Zavarzinia sp. CC-PAN008]|uniref:PepSY domain-containing protein n=1 Tax=Zavarzinia sp. CC-PAN008 TaxID=3243332 RepID=UPI003F745DC5
MSRLMTFVLAFSVVLGLGWQAFAADACPADGKPALSEAQIRAFLTDAGYTDIRSLGTEDGCVEAKGLDAKGERFEVYLKPATGEFVTLH